MLISLHEPFETESPPVETVSVGWDMSHDYCSPIHCLELCEFILEPFHLVSWVVAVLDEIPIQIVACLSVDPNESGIWVDSAIIESKNFAVITVLSKVRQNISTEPRLPRR